MKVLALATLLAGATLAAPAQQNTTTSVRRLSLQDCIQMTLSQNIDLQISRYDPEIAFYALRAAYGAYDPSLSFSGQHNHSEAGSRLLSGGFSIPGSITDSDSFNAGLGNGLTPWGMTYDVSANVSDSYGRSFSVSTNGSLIPNGFESSGGSLSGTIRQPLLRNFWIDNARLSIRVNRLALKQSELQLQLDLMNTLTSVETTYNNLIAARESVLVQQKAVELAEQLASENQRRVEVGAMAPLDAKQAQSQAATAHASLISAQANLAVQENALRRLISSNYVDWAFSPVEPTGTLTAEKREFDLQESWKRGLTQHPTILGARLAVERQGIQVKYLKNQLFPQLDLVATYGYNGSGREFSGSLFEIQDRDRPFYTYGGQISIPLANQSARNNYKSSKVSFQQVVLSLKNTEETLMRSIDDAIKLAQASYERVAATRAAREYAEDALAAEQKKLEQGRSTTYLVLQQQRDLTASRGDEIQALVSYKNNLSNLSLAEGTTLERLGIELDVK